jgi:ATP-binding cassette subfamily F protein 3
LITIKNISVHFSGEYLFNNVSFLIRKRDRIGLVGRNGSGKTTLLNIIAGLLKPETGEVVIPGDARIGYLPQEKKISSEMSVFEEALTAFDDILALQRQIEKLNQEISLREDYQSDSYQKLIEELAEFNERYQVVGGEQVEASTEKVLTGLGFERADFHRPMTELSLGWQMRAELSKILLAKPDVLLLDEPTNHLDIESIQWLEEFLVNYHGSVILVSHDRAFLDNVTKRTIEISDQKIYDYKENYSGYILAREERLENQIATFNNQQKQIKQIERFIERFRYKNTKARQVQSRIKMLDKMPKIEIEDIDDTTFSFRFPPAPRGGKVTVETKGLIKKYAKKVVLDNIDVAIINRDKIAFVGKNGEGKSTLSRILAKNLQYEGSVRYGHQVEIGYYAQEQSEMLDGSKTVFETIDDIALGDMRTRVRDILGMFLFSGDSIDKKVKVLSGGEKSRLSLARLLLTPVNLLILDEPTNHLDMRSKDMLKNALIQYDGTLIIVSHDRDFLQGLTNKVFEFRNRNVREYIGDIYDYLYSRKMRSLHELEDHKSSSKGNGTQPSEKKLQWEKGKKIDRDIRKLERKLEQLEKLIENEEKEISSYDELLIDPVANSKIIEEDDLYKKYEEVKKKHQENMDSWEKLQVELEDIRQKREQIKG